MAFGAGSAIAHEGVKHMMGSSSSSNSRESPSSINNKSSTTSRCSNSMSNLMS